MGIIRLHCSSLSVAVVVATFSKTVCICERIARDRHHADIHVEFKQLFVARSSRICRIVKELVGTEYLEENQHLRQPDFLTFKRLLDKCMTTLPGEAPRAFDPNSYVDFQRFKRDFFVVYEKCGLDSLVLWTQIRSFIKGSVEALLQPGTCKFVTLDEYLDFVKFGSSRCRLSEEQRRIAYEVFEKYEAEKGRLNLWDDCDLMTSIHGKLDESIRSSNFPDELYYDKLYVDEVQDYTQAEIALFLKLCKPGSFFLAGVSGCTLNYFWAFKVKCVTDKSFLFRDFQDAAQAVVGKFVSK